MMRIRSLFEPRTPSSPVSQHPGDKLETMDKLSALKNAKSMLDHFPNRVDFDHLMLNARQCSANVSPSTKSTRLNPFRLVSSLDSPRLLAALETLAYENRTVSSIPLNACRIDDVLVDLALGYALTSRGAAIRESTAVAVRIDPEYRTAAINEDTRNFQVYDRPIIHMFHRAIPAYGHFIFDGMIAIIRFLPYIQCGAFKLLIPPFMPHWTEDMLGIIGVPADAMVRFDGARAVWFRDLVVSSSLEALQPFWPDRLLARSFRKLVQDRLCGDDRPSPEEGAKRVYLSRGNQTTYSERFVGNENEVVDFLRARGFAILECGNMTMEQQFHAFNSAEYIVGPHGSAFANLVYGRSGIKVIDIMPKHWVGIFENTLEWPHDPNHISWILNMTTVFDQNYTLILSDSDKRELPPLVEYPDARRFGIETKVNIADLEEALSALPT